MSSSSRKSKYLAVAIAATCGAGVVTTVQSAQTYVQPQMDVRAETNTNLTLDPDGSPNGSAEGYIADLGVLLGYVTPRGETSIRPRVRFQHYPDFDEREKVEGFLNWLTRYEWERSRFDFAARYSQQDTYNYDTRSGEFDPLDPSDPTAVGSGQSLIGETQTEVEVRPRYTYEFTERLSAGVGGEYQTANYDADSGPSRHVDYSYWLVNGDIRWALDERSHIGVGGFFSQYDPKRGGGDADGYGVGLVYGYRWSERMAIEATLGYETNDPKYPVPGQSDEKTSSVGGSISAFGEGEVSKWRFFVSQRYAPNYYGQLRQLDQVRFQYDRRLSPRLDFVGAARYESQEQLSNDPTSGRDIARLDLGLRWLFSRTWFVQGGYAYMWQEEGNEGDADNNRVYLGVGYKGLGRER